MWNLFFILFAYKLIFIFHIDSIIREWVFNRMKRGVLLHRLSHHVLNLSPKHQKVTKLSKYCSHFFFRSMINQDEKYLFLQWSCGLSDLLRWLYLLFSTLTQALACRLGSQRYSVYLVDITLFYNYYRWWILPVEFQSDFRWENMHQSFW